MPEFRLKRILKIGATLGHSLLLIAQAFPATEAIAVDFAAPCCAIAARFKSLGEEHHVCAGGRDDASLDWTQTTMVLLELSNASMSFFLWESFRLLRLSGIALHVEQRQHTPEMPLFEQVMRDWDSFYNNEPPWSTLHGIDLDALIRDTGFPSDAIFHGGVMAVVNPSLFPGAAEVAAAKRLGG